MTPLLVRRAENKLSFSHSWWYSKLSAFSIQKKQKKSLSPIFHALFTQQLQHQHNHSKVAIHHCHCYPRRFTQLHQQLRSKACLKGSCHQRRRAGGTCQTCLVKTLRIKPQVCLWSTAQRTRVETWTVGHVTPVLSPLDWGVYLRQRHQS